ncbi:MAG: arylesterase [Sphingomonadales bacterium]|nr:arylesterase [Sphingomonadales bacterium]MDE2168421.1 arylesterase [Sphingomonadales bacterium]
MMALAGAVLALSACGQAGGEQSAQDPVTATPSDAPSGASSPAVAGPERRIVALGDSLLAGYGLRPEQAYPPRLEAALRSAGINARVVNAGVSGDTTADGLARLDFTLSSIESGGGKVDLLLLSLGGNDMLRGLSPAATRANLEAILGKLDAHHIPVVLLGMMAAPNMGADYAKAFDAIYPDLARQHHAALVPFFMAPINGKPGMQLPDHIHPTPEGVEAMVKATLPTVEGALPQHPRLPM